MEILARISKNSSANKEEAFTRLYRYLLRPDIYYVAYKNLYANNGAATKGVNNDTADGFSEAKIENIIKSLANETYQPTPVRRTYIEKRDNPSKKRPLGIPTFTDKLVQEALRMVMEAVYEPIFLDCSHGFRPKRSCHTAVQSLKKEFNGARWFVEGDIKGCFDNIDHSTLIRFAGEKIKDARLIKLIYKFLKAGYMENWQYHKTYSGTPQGGIISPLLANIYLHELDKFVIQLKTEFDKHEKHGKRTSEYHRITSKMDRLRKAIEISHGDERLRLIAEYKQAKAEKLKTPSKSQTDKKLKYIRYADDFLIGINGSQEDCQWVKSKLAKFIGNSLKMELSDKKTLITHSNKYARFLGYDVRVRRNGKTKRDGKLKYTKRTLSNNTELVIPLTDKIHKFIFDNGIARQINGTLEPIKKPSLFHITDLEIVSSYNAELRGICNYYHLASNFNKLSFFAYLMEYSCLKTLAAKHKCSVKKVWAKYQDGNGGWGIPYETKSGMKCLYFANYADCKSTKVSADKVTNVPNIMRQAVTTFEQRLKAKVCELCGTTESECFEIHHVNKVKNLKGKQPWERVMIAKKRKTMVVCRECHLNIHNQ
jgi:group II intron reverse transcriptase/maturase